MKEELGDVHAALRLIPEYSALGRDQYTISRLGGLTNRVYKIEPQGALTAVIVRIPGQGTEEYIDRKVEAHNAVMAAKAGVSAEVLYSDAQAGLMISRCIPDIETMTPNGFRERTGAPGRAGKALRTLHSSGVQFEFRFELFSMIDEYLNVLSGKTLDMPEGYNDVVRQAQPVKIALQKKPVPLAPCHCDPLCENFLDDGKVMWIVDWEYSGMNDPFWDLGDLSVEGEFTDQQDMEMMQAYCNGDASDTEMARMIIYKAMCDLLWTLWGLIQHADGNPAEDFWAYSIGRFERCKKLMNSDAFKQAVVLIAE
ncbi:MAG: choline/ethanolamine kinase family protein [Granulosicoccus sp.]